MKIPAGEIKPGDVILPPERELRLWMRERVAEEGLPGDALELTVLDVIEGRPDKRGRWIKIRTCHAATWRTPGGAL